MTREFLKKKVTSKKSNALDMFFFLMQCQAKSHSYLPQGQQTNKIKTKVLESKELLMESISEFSFFSEIIYCHIIFISKFPRFIS